MFPLLSLPDTQSLPICDRLKIQFILTEIEVERLTFFDWKENLVTA